jgi:hypothetical protein
MSGESMTNDPPSESGARPPRRALSLRKRLTIVIAFVCFGILALLRWERWQCLDAQGFVLNESKGVLWSWQEAAPAIAPAGTTVIVYRKINFIPPLVQDRRLMMSPMIPPRVLPKSAPATQIMRPG